MPSQVFPYSLNISRSIGYFLRTPVRLQTYRNLCYLLLMFPLGIGYYTVLTIGFPLGVPLEVAIPIGILVVIPLLVLVTRLANFERSLVRILLDVNIHSTAAEIERNWWNRSRQLVTDNRTWKAIVYLLSKLVGGTIVLGLMSWLLMTAGQFILAPVYYKHAPVVAHGPIPSSWFTLDLLFGWDTLLIGLTTTFQIGSWNIETLPGALLVAGLGIVLLLVSLQFFNTLAWAWARYAKTMLT